MPRVPSPLRVRWLVKGLGPGGAERLLVAAAGVHDRRRFEISCSYLLPWKQQLVSELEARDVRTSCLEVRDERDLRWARRLRRQLIAAPVDVLHSHSPYPAGIARLVVASLPPRVRPRLVYTLHNTWESFAGPTRAVNGATMRWDAAELAVSELVRATLSPRRAARMEVLIHGIDRSAIVAQRDRAGVRSELGLAANAFVVGTVANLRAQKDYPNLLAAAAHLRDRGVPVQFLTVGQGPLADETAAEHERLGLQSVVKLLGERSDAVRVMSACDAFVLASNNEGLPVAMMEALALGLPIVATAVGGVPEIVNDSNGVLVPPRDPMALADAIAALAEDPDRRNGLAHGAEASAERFDVRRTVTRLEQLYVDLTARAR